MSAPTPEETKERTALVYNTAADNFDHSALGFWDYFGRKTVDQLSLQTGAQVLDVCCGSGASAIPASEAVGPSGLVVGIDLADKLLELARAKAEPDEVTTENRWHPLRSPDDWWTIVMGTGHRGTIERLSLPERTAVREANLAFIRDHGIDRLPTNALYAVATKKE